MYLHLYTRRPDRLDGFFSTIGKNAGKACTIHAGYDDFPDGRYDTVINCVGVGTIKKMQGNYSDYFMIGETYDNLIIRYLLDVSPDSLYISFSSGVVYGRGHCAPVEENTMNCIAVNNVPPQDYYAITRLNSEAKHRSFENLWIIDLRPFSYFSRFIDLTDGYFITDLISCILDKKVFVTDSVNIIRDYIHPEDLFAAVRRCMEAPKINIAFDVNSCKPVDKEEILDYFSSVYGLRYDMVKSLNNVGATGAKSIYCSRYKGISSIGYIPQYSSMETIKQETEHILSSRSTVNVFKQLRR